MEDTAGHKMLKKSRTSIKISENYRGPEYHENYFREIDSFHLTSFFLPEHLKFSSPTWKGMGPCPDD